ncbi:MAG: hypothetical protein U0795_18120 [Pirellulales bacterium]
MTRDAQELVSRYLDDALTAEEHAALSDWIRRSPENARQFAEATLLHDRLRNEQIALASMADLDAPAPITRPACAPQQNSSRRSWPRRITSAAGALTAVMAVVAIVWTALSGSSASAAMELRRILAASFELTDRVYQIRVDEPAVPARRGRGDAAIDRSRPPKPPMDNAMLYVRGRQFVLVRQTPEGQPFVTGSDGQTSWAVRPDGPVRVSTDLTRFSRDLPGHESSLPLTDIREGLERLRAAYQLEVLPAEASDDSVEGAEEPIRRMIAVKKRGFRGPRRVEITYSVSSGIIRQMRFIEMPYGPERLTLTMTLVDRLPLGEDFFRHESHHDSSRRVEYEE